MFAHRLAAHLQMLAKLVQSLAVFLVQPVKQSATTGIGQGSENDVHR